ncbi:right-handed parallel beta-helix repeat-containing protein [Streptantibioticus cattleyicolor]|uniref:Right handed beta helix domain-containing protein n=1 Tax=Streptantibioticus cattleyicolor (strain ATCC 35852 / DSM 46488 / JCM 4925 / NBRC 14057 / NRRL 8057) TaxID=1003195 RepID=F8JN58_STREN|nr:right-handed parallel beta-helix repeat-containing protein [Streptantibioticus cattleyicolor]AEW99191.1 hypothetical protein SCATT_p09980 [Streptantibioticus cattleyicolor NRRL 8057 = DSM 46488]CCB71766.1 conserved protein of unknown function [Streptantibioticus cattleyicolor NRRL 8057 = DSM 46488]
MDDTEPQAASPTTELPRGNRLHVAPWGDDTWPGTLDRPLATPGGALRVVRSRTPAPDGGDVVVSFRAGTYRLDEPWVLGAHPGDSGADGHRVIYQAYGYGTDHAEEAVLSGGRPVTGWIPDPGGVWRAEIGPLEPRQLYVDGRRAERASLRPGIPGNVTTTETGYVTDSVLPQSWHDPASIEFVHTGVNPWSEARCPVAEITGDAASTTITMAQPAFRHARDLYAARFHGELAAANGERGSLGVPASAENSASFLTEPGTFALDRSTPGHHVLHYLPRPGEDPEHTEFVVPVLDELLVGAGTEDRPLHDVVLRGLTFRHAGWTAPGGPGGFAHYHGNTYHDGGPLERVTVADGMAELAVPGRPALVPSAVRFTSATRITLHGNRFTGLGAGAIGFSGPGGDNTVTGNLVEDVSGAAVSLDRTAGVRVEDNLIHHTGREYHGTPAVWIADCHHVTVARNEIHHVPYSGIVVIGGDRTARVRIEDNLVHHTMTVLADGGGIYLAGPQGTCYADGTLVRGNVVRDTLTPYNFGLYTDYGAAWVTVLGNVVHRADAPIVLRVTPPLENVAFVGNFWDDHPAGDDDPPAGVLHAANTVLPAGDFDQALAAHPAGAAILSAAGRRGG